MDEEMEAGVGYAFLNDWPRRRFEVLGYSTALAILVFALLRMTVDRDWDNSLLGVPILLLAVFVPGSAILRIMRIHGIGMIKPIIFSLAIGLLLLMLTGGALNLLHYVSPIGSPLNLEIINLAYAGLILVLVTSASRRDYDFIPPPRATIGIWTVLILCFAVLLPLVVVVGTRVGGYDGDRSIIFYSLIAVCASPLILLSRSTKTYGPIVFSLSLSLILHQCLMTNYLIGTDVFWEYFTALTSTDQGYWDVAFRFNTNTALSMTTLPPMLTQLTSIQTLEILKMVYPFFFSFTALGLFKAVEGQFGSKPALAASLLYIGDRVFFAEMMQYTKQQIAEIFLVVFFLVILDKHMSVRVRRTLAFVALSGVVVSHYATSYIAIGFVVGLVGLNALWHLASQTGWIKGAEREPLGRWFVGTVKSWYTDQRDNRTVNLRLMGAFLLLFFVWYSITASGVILHYGSNIGDHVSIPGSEPFLLYRMDIIEYLLIDYGTNLHNVEKYLTVFSIIVCVIGVVYALTHFRRLSEREPSQEFLMLGVLSTFIVIGCFTIYRLTLTFSYARFFHISFIFLSGFFLLGIYAITSFFWRKCAKGGSVIKQLNGNGLATKVAVVALTAFLLFNTSVIYHSMGEYGRSFAMDPEISYSAYSDSDVLAYKWVGDDGRRGPAQVRTDWPMYPMFYPEWSDVGRIKYQWSEDDTDKLVFLSTWNVKHNWIISGNYNGSSLQSYTPLKNILNQTEGRQEIIYSTGGGAKILYIPPQDVNTNPVGPQFHKYEDTPLYVFSSALVVALALISVTLLIRRLR